jgi:hypothetical protein
MIYSHYYGVMKRKISKIQVLSIALLFALTATMGIFGPAGAITSAWPSTNDANRAAGNPHVNLVEATTDSVTLELFSDKNYLVNFEFRVDGETPETYANGSALTPNQVVNSDGEYDVVTYAYAIANPETRDVTYPGCNLDKTNSAWDGWGTFCPKPYDGSSFLPSSFNITIDANEKVEVRQALGGEDSHRFDWVQFDVIEGDNAGPNVSNVVLDDVEVDDAHIRSNNCEAIQQTYLVRGEFNFSAVIDDELSDVEKASYRVRKLNPNGCSNTSVFSSSRANLQYTEGRWSTTAPFDTKQIENDGVYTIQLQTTDSVGNETTKYIDLLVDNTSPIAEITAPADGDVLRGAVTLTAEVTDENPMNSHFEIRDAGNKSVASNTKRNGLKTHEFTWDTAQVDDGEYAIYFEARDKASNKDGSRNNLGDSVDKISVTVDNTKPTLSIVNPVQGQYVSGIVELRGGASDNLSGIDRVEVRVNEIDAIAGKYKASALGMQIADYDLITENYSYDIDTTAFNDGPHRIQVRTYDNAGNRRILYLDVDVDNTAPEVDAGNDQTVIGKSAALSATATDNLTNVAQLVYLWEVIDGPSINTVKLLPASNAAEVEAQVEEYGEYEFRVTVSDEAGNQASDTVQVTFTEYSGMSVIPDVSNRGRSGQAPANNRNNVNNPQALAATNANQVGAQNQAQQETEETEDEEGGEVLAEDTAGAFRKNGMSSASTTAGSLAEQASVNSSLLSDFWWIPASIIVAAMGFFFAGRRVQDE